MAWPNHSGVYIYMATLNVGAGQAYATLSAAVCASRDGDVIAVQAGTYVNDFATISTDITIVGVGGMANFVATVAPPNGKGILVTQSNVTIQNLSFSGAAVADGNGAGIRYEGGNLVIIDSYFHDNQDGLLANSDPNGTIRIVGSEFASNGTGDGFTHNLYVNNIASLVIDDSYFHDANVGHQIKSRAQSTTITNSRIYDGNGTGSYSIDLPNGGVGVIRNNVIQQGPNSDNPAIIHYGGESAAYAGSSLLIEDNVVVNDMSGSSSARLLSNATTVTGTLSDNAVYGLTAGQIATGSATVSGTTFLSTRPTLDTSATGLHADLVVSSLGLGAASVTQGQNLGFVYTIVNDGEAQSNVGYGGFYIDGTDEAHFRGSNLTDPLGTGASRTLFNGFNTSNLSVGQHTLFVGADNFGQTSESNEGNNWRSITFTVTAPPQADLVVSSLGLGAASVGQGQNLGFVYTVVNNGAAQSNVGYGGFYIDGTDAAHFVGSNLTDPLGSGASRTLFNGFNTSNLSVGQHTLFVDADNFGQTSESNEGNNWQAIAFTVTAPPQADLVVSSLGLGAASVGQGQNLGFVYTVLNNGAAQSNVGYGGFYIDGTDAAHFVGNNLTDPLGSGASRTLFNGFNTGNLSVGQHTLFVGADNFGQTAESNEGNNWQAIAFTVTAPPQADLVVSSLGLGAASVTQGQNLGFVYTILNNGAAQSNVGYGGFYIDGTDAAHFVGNNLTDPLGSGASRTLFNGFNTSNLSVGQHTLFVGADNFGQTAESNEGNNWQAITFTVTAPPQADLVVSSLGLGAASVTRGQNLGFVYSIVNNGAAQSNVGYGGFYIDGTDAAHFVGTNLTDPLGSGASRTLFNGFNTSNLSVGQHTLFVGADNFGQTAESNEGNNWQAITFTVTAPQANGSSLISSGGTSAANNQATIANGMADVPLSPLHEWMTIL